MSELRTLVVGCLQLDSSAGSKDANLQRADELLEREAARLGLAPADRPPPPPPPSTPAPAHPVSTPSRRSRDLQLVHALAFAPHCMVPRVAWTWAEGLQDPERSPTLRQLRGWARRWGCFVACTLLEAHPDGHFYNTVGF